MKTEDRITFRCPHCEATLAAAPRMAGKHGRCPKCQNPVDVPKEAESLQGSRGGRS